MFLDLNIKCSFTSEHSVAFLLRTSKPIRILRTPVGVVLNYGTSEMESNEKVAARDAPPPTNLEYISAMQ
jgi:hypothetical protein